MQYSKIAASTFGGYLNEFLSSLELRSVAIGVAGVVALLLGRKLVCGCCGFKLFK